jgi:hypothetical protein
MTNEQIWNANAAHGRIFQDLFAPFAVSRSSRLQHLDFEKAPRAAAARAVTFIFL